MSTLRTHNLGAGLFARCVDPSSGSDGQVIELSADGKGTLRMNPAVASSLGNVAALSVAASAVRFVSTATPILGGTVAHALASTGTVYFGGSSVTAATGHPLAPGSTLKLDGLGDLSMLYFICAGSDTAELRCAVLLP